MKSLNCSLVERGGNLSVLVKTSRFFKIVSCSLFLLFFYTLSFSASEWKPIGKLKVSSNRYTFLATTPIGDLIALTFPDSKGSNANGIPALLIKNPTSSTPQVIELCRVKFPEGRGYSGVACDELGQFWVSGDTGEGISSFVKKFKPDGKADITFGNSGEIRPNKRCLGLDVVGVFLLLAVDWCEIQIYHKDTGELINTIPKPPIAQAIYLRDIAVDPATLNIYGIARGTVCAWEGGTPNTAQNYKWRIIHQGNTEALAGEGISFDPFGRNILHSPRPGKFVWEVKRHGEMDKIELPLAMQKAQLCDNAVSFDGLNLFVSDSLSECIHLLRRTEMPAAQDIADYKSSTPTNPIQINSVYQAEQIKQVEWQRSYTAIMDEVRQRHLPIVIYFRSETTPSCLELEKNVLLTPNFNKVAQRFICVFEDVKISRLLAYKFGIYKVPHIVILDRNGEPAIRFSGNINPNELYNVLSRVN